MKTIAKQSGANLTHRFQHLLLEVKGVRHQRHARSLSESILKNKGVIEASLSATGMFQLEWDTEVINEAAVKSAIEKTGLKIQKEPSEKHEHKEGDGHDHAHGGFLGENTELYFAIGSGVFWLTGLITFFSSLVFPRLVNDNTICRIALILGGYFTLLEAIETIRKGKFEIDFLMLSGSSWCCCTWEMGGSELYLLFLFSLGHALGKLCHE